MKIKFISILTLLFLSHFVIAQSRSGLILKGGVNFANVSINNNGNVDDAKMLTSFQVGLMGDLPIAAGFFVQPGLIFTGKGAKSQSGQTSDASYYRATTNPYYIEVPLNIVFKAGADDKFFVGAGPYAAMGIAGKRKIDGKFLGVSYSSEKSINFSNDDPATNYEEGAGLGIMKRFDYGLNALAGFEGKKTILSVNYGLGLAKLQSGTTNGNDNNNKHRVLSVTLGFKL